MLRIGMLTSGGDCQGLNSAIRGVAKGLYEGRPDVEIIGYLDGFRGLIEGDYRLMSPENFSGILTLGGTILGTSRRPFKEINDPADPESSFEETRFEAMIRNYKMQKLDCLVVLGGNGSHKTAHALSEAGLRVVTLPKTIDNDLWGTDMTFGFQSAVSIATDVIDGIHTTATSHGRVFVIELMGHKAGWLTLHAGVAGGADVILIPEIPYSLESIKSALEKRTEEGKRFSIIAMAEGAVTQEEAQMSRKEFKQSRKDSDFPSISYQLADKINNDFDQEVRVTVPGHYQRGGTPIPEDRVFSTQCGAKAAKSILAGEFGVMVAMKNNQMTTIPLTEVAGKLKLVPQDSELVAQARSLGIYFGDE